MSESDLLAQVRLECSRGATRLFRNNIALAWVGIPVHRDAHTITLRNYRPLHAGLCEGSSDLIGWTARENVAIFTAIETKTLRGRVSEEQERFIEAVRAAGGIAGVARSVEDALALLA